ncbi:hypothetical protein PAMA_010004 [Pampus argenteus]
MSLRVLKEELQRPQSSVRSPDRRLACSKAPWHPGHPDLNEAIPETELLDNSIQKGRAQLSVKARRHRPSRSRYRDSVSSTEGDDSLERKVRRSPEDGGASLAAPPRGRYHQLTNATSQEALVTPSTSPSKSCPSADCSPVYLRRNRRPDSEGSFVPFTWFSEGRGSLSSSGTPPCSPKIPPLSSPRPRKSHSQESGLSGEFSPPQTSYTSPPVDSSSSRSSHPYHTLSQSSDEVTHGSMCKSPARYLFILVTYDLPPPQTCDESSCLVSSWTSQQVCQWLQGLNMEQYVPEFSARDIDGQQLLQMDGNKLKGLGVLSSSDRSTLKRRIKDIQTAVEKERKALDKLEKQKEKQRRKDQEQRRN